MTKRPKRRKGGQPGNQNARKHGFTKRIERTLTIRYPKLTKRIERTLTIKYPKLTKRISLDFQPFSPQNPPFTLMEKKEKNLAFYKTNESGFITARICYLRRL
jgi:hypothetical protein